MYFMVKSVSRLSPASLIRTFTTTCRIMAVSKDQIVQKLTKELEPTHLEVDDVSGGCGASFAILVVSQKFDGQKPLQRQRLVNKILAEEIKDLHALTQKTLTPDQWQKQSQ